MSKERKDNSFIKKPVYPGGTAAYRKFIKDNLKYPKEAIANKTEGTVFLKYTIDHKGKVSDPLVIKGIGHGCNEEAKRIVKLLKFEIPKGPRKLRVTFHRRSQITFRLPKKATAPAPKAPKPEATKPKAVPSKAQSLSMVYQYKPADKKTAPVTKKKTYGYTITINKR